MFAEIIEIGFTPKSKSPYCKVKISSDSFRTIWGTTTQKVGDFVEILIDNANNATFDNGTKDTTIVAAAKAESTKRRNAWGD